MIKNNEYPREFKIITSKSNLVEERQLTHPLQWLPILLSLS